MNFNTFFLRSFRVLLLPFALLYGAVVWLRNLLYDKNLLKSTDFNLPLISVGNLSVGGTGKSPMVEYLLGLLHGRYKVATMSRGYKRRTKGYVLAGESTTALEVGDEPMQFHVKFPDVAVAVGEERIVAIPQLLFDRPETEVVVLDDAFQHRAIRPGLQILLTDSNNLYCDDFFLPTGDLRDQPSSARRADIVVVTKCRPDLREKDRKSIAGKLALRDDQPLFFTSIRYGEPYHISQRTNRKISRGTEVLLVCGIANPVPLTRYLQEECGTYETLYYDDHHIFTIDDLREIRKRYQRIKSSDRLILTTEKDAVRLLKFKDELTDMPLFVIPIAVGFLFNEEERFNGIISTFIDSFHKRQNGPEPPGH
jgi:tetraacyldisaccharide 4'-kinase